jgi:hypothetical protein
MKEGEGGWQQMMGDFQSEKERAERNGGRKGWEDRG